MFGVLTVNIGIEGWFSTRVREVVGASLSAAQAYEGEQRSTLTEDAKALADFINRAQSTQAHILTDGDLRPVLVQGQGLVQRGLKTVGGSLDRLVSKEKMTAADRDASRSP